MISKRIYQKLIYAVLTLAMVMLSACSGSDITADNPNLGIYKATTAEMSGIKLDVDDAFAGGFTIELKKKGKAHLQSGDEGGNFRWTLEGDHFHGEGGGATFDGTLKDGVMVLDNLEDSGITLTLVCDEVMAKAGETGGNESGEMDKAEGDDESAKVETDEVKDADGSDEEKALEADDSESTDGSMAGKLGSMLDTHASDAGKYDIYTVTQNGKAYMKEDLAAKGIDAWIEMNPDGTGRINLVGDLMDMEWGDGRIVVPENSEGGRDEYRYSFANEFLVLVDEDMTLAFIKDEDWSTSLSSDSDM